MKLENTKNKLIDKLPLIIILYCAVQPVLDVLGYWQGVWGISNAFTLIVRMLLLFGSVLLGFILSDNRKAYWIMAGVLVFITVGHVAACVTEGDGYHEAVLDLINLVRIYLTPLTVLCLITFFKKNNKSFDAMIYGMTAALAIIIAVQAISTVTGTDPHTYDDEINTLGVMGWFNWTNSQSSIMGVTLPVALCYALAKEKKRIWPIALVTAVGELGLYILAPKLTYASLIAAGFGIGAVLFLKDKTRRRQAVVILVITAIFIGLYPISPCAGRQAATISLTEKHRDELKKALDEMSDDERSEMEYTYETFAYGTVKHFGFERTYEIYDRTDNLYILSNTRTEKLNYCRLRMQDGNILSKLFGLSLYDYKEPMKVHDEATDLWVDGYQNYDCENDIPGMYFLTGAFGAAAMIGFILYFGIIALIRIFNNIKKNLTVEMTAFGIAYCCSLVHIVCTACMLRRNNGGVFLAMVLAGLWYLAQEREESVDAKAVGE